MVNVCIDEDVLVEMLVNRLRCWTDDNNVVELYEKMYTNEVEGGCFDGCKVDIMQIVDNDYVNYCSVVSEGDGEFDELLQIYKEQGCGDCSCESSYYQYIEAVDDEDEPTMFLVR